LVHLALQIGEPGGVVLIKVESQDIRSTLHNIQ
jgi:hypothetical protein